MVETQEDEGGLFYVETFTEGLLFQYRIQEVYYRGRTRFQWVDIMDLALFGKTLFLDGKLQSSALDEFIFHEALVHPALYLHTAPRRILIVGGGEGATLREVLRHPTVGEVVMVDLDEELVHLCETYLSEWSGGAFKDGRTLLQFEEARKFMEKTEGKWDVVILDLTEPLPEGPSFRLYTIEFYQRIYEILSEDGLLVVQAGSASPFYSDLFYSITKTLRELFPEVVPYTAHLFSFHIPWGLVLASKRAKFREVRKQRKILSGLRYFHPSLLDGLFVLPLYFEEDLKAKGRVLSDEKPFVWQA